MTVFISFPAKHYLFLDNRKIQSRLGDELQRRCHLLNLLAEMSTTGRSENINQREPRCKQTANFKLELLLSFYTEHKEEFRAPCLLINALLVSNFHTTV